MIHSFTCRTTKYDYLSTYVVLKHVCHDSVLWGGHTSKKVKCSLRRNMYSVRLSVVLAL